MFCKGPNNQGSFITRRLTPSLVKFLNVPLFIPSEHNLLLIIFPGKFSRSIAAELSAAADQQLRSELPLGEDRSSLLPSVTIHLVFAGDLLIDGDDSPCIL